MKLLRIIASADPRTGGPIEGVLRVGEILAREGHEQHLVTLDPPQAPFLGRLPGTIIPLGRAGDADRGTASRRSSGAATAIPNGSCHGCANICATMTRRSSRVCGITPRSPRAGRW